MPHFFTLTTLCHASPALDHSIPGEPSTVKRHQTYVGSDALFPQDKKPEQLYDVSHPIAACPRQQLSGLGHWAKGVGKACCRARKVAMYLHVQ